MNLTKFPMRISYIVKHGMRSCEEHEFKKKNMKEKSTLREFLAKMEKENDKIATCKTMIKMVNLEVNLDAPSRY